MVDAPEIKVTEQDGLKVIVEYSINDKGEKIKITRKVKTVVRKQKANHAVIERRQWKKFGQATGHGTFDEGITTLGEEVTLKLGVRALNEVEQKPKLTVDEQVKKLTTSAITCRVCKGEHFTAKCPYKDTLTPLSETLDKLASPAAFSSDNVSGADGSAAAKPTLGGGKYIPPSQRAKMGIPPSASAAGSSSGRSSSAYQPPGGDGGELTTLRVSNLSEYAQDQDLYSLFSKFGGIQRVKVAQDYETRMCRGYAFVTFNIRRSAELAMEKMDGYPFDNLILKVEWAQR
ncbi:hypothetical protein MIR68_007817 [Amoeboaphelidium protococcarum]|nr:hypothetical protein MIR68_007817 [Amoeboaphelidium protococcarum]